MALRNCMLVLLVALAFCGICSGAGAGAAYKVGGTGGWIKGPDYNHWSSSKEFHVGDTLLFSYSPYHNMFEVSEEGYKSCDPSSPITAYSSGLDNIMLKRPGHYYFLCGMPDHCHAGQKVEVVVSSLHTPADSPVISLIQAPSGGLASPSSTPSPTPSALSTPSTLSQSPFGLSTPSTPSPAPSVSSSPIYKVGGPGGWIIGVNYNQWSSSKEFNVGDTLLFSYNNNYHNVVEVTEQGFKTCNSSSPIAAYSSGSDYIMLERSGHYYFLYGATGHCEAGQKVEVVVNLPTADGFVSSPSLAPSGLSTPSATIATPSPSTPHPHYSAATTIDAPKLALAVFVSLLASLFI